jgi:hypothetical protein
MRVHLAALGDVHAPLPSQRKHSCLCHRLQHASLLLRLPQIDLEVVSHGQQLVQIEVIVLGDAMRARCPRHAAARRLAAHAARPADQAAVRRALPAPGQQALEKDATAAAIVAG